MAKTPKKPDHKNVKTSSVDNSTPKGVEQKSGGPGRLPEVSTTRPRPEHLELDWNEKNEPK